MSKLNVKVLVDDQHLEQILEVAQGLQSAGMSVEQTMDTLGIITGSCDSEKMAVLSQVEGVSAIEPEQIVQIAPPESDLQ